MSTEITKQEIHEYIENKLKYLDKLHNDIKQRLSSIPLELYIIGRDGKLTQSLDIYKSEVYALISVERNYVELCQKLNK